MRANAVRDVRFSARDIPCGAHNSDSARAEGRNGACALTAAVRKNFSAGKVTAYPAVRKWTTDAIRNAFNLTSEEGGGSECALCALEFDDVSGGLRFRPVRFGFSNVFAHAKGKDSGRLRSSAVMTARVDHFRTYEKSVQQFKPLSMETALAARVLGRVCRSGSGHACFVRGCE
jgi:hypothetical protein